MENKEVIKIQVSEEYKVFVNKGEVRIVKVENEFKPGEFVAETKSCSAFIYKGTDSAGYHCFYAGLDCDHDLVVSEENWRFGNGELRQATDKERQELISALADKGLQWNAAEKRIEKEKWRAPIGEQYFYLLDNFVVDSHFESNDKIDCGLYDLGNYFRTKEQAEKAVGVIKEALRRFFTEN